MKTVEKKLTMSKSDTIDRRYFISLGAADKQRKMMILLTLFSFCFCSFSFSTCIKPFHLVFHWKFVHNEMRFFIAFTNTVYINFDDFHQGYTAFELRFSPTAGTRRKGWRRMRRKKTTHWCLSLTRRKDSQKDDTRFSSRRDVHIVFHKSWQILCSHEQTHTKY